MKILFFYQYFGTPKGSWSTRIYELCRRWVEGGHEVTVVTAPYEKSDIQVKGIVSRQRIDGINLIVINAGDSNRLSVPRRILRALSFAILSSYYALKLNSDIVIASSGPITIGLPMVVARKLKKSKTVFEVRDLWPAGGIEMGMITKTWQKKLALWFERQCYENSDMVVTASKGQESHIMSRFPLLKTLVITNASDNKLFGVKTSEQIPEEFRGKPLFTHIGSLGFIHNCRFLLEVAKYLQLNHPRTEIEILFIGDGAQRAELFKFKEDHQLKNVHFLGLMPKQDLPVWVHNSTATLFSTLDNPVQNTCSPNKIFDSFAAGVPIIQTTTGWIYDMVEKENCGVNVPPGDIKAFANAVILLTNDAKLRQEKAANARRLAQTEFDRDYLAKKYLNALISIGDE